MKQTEKPGAGRGHPWMCLTEPHTHTHTFVHTHSHTRTHIVSLSVWKLSEAACQLHLSPPLPVLCDCQVKEMSIHLPKWPPGSPVPRTEKMGRHPPTLSPQFSPQSPVTQALYSLGCNNFSTIAVYPTILLGSWPPLATDRHTHSRVL